MEDSKFWPTLLREAGYRHAPDIDFEIDLFGDSNKNFRIIEKHGYHHKVTIPFNIDCLGEIVNKAREQDVDLGLFTYVYCGAENLSLLFQDEHAAMWVRLVYEGR